MIEQKQCKFCEALQTYKNIRQFNNANFEPKLFEEYNVALVVRCWKKGNKRTAGRTTDYRYRGIGYKLNYCPECGRKVQELSNNSPKVDSNSGDLISRCDLFYRLENAQTLADAYAVIHGMSTIEPEHKKGKWIYKDDLNQYFCSECGYPSLTYDDVYIYSMDLPNFCEECGADMRTANEEGD